MTKKLVKATHGSNKTPLVIGDVKIPCYVLEDGKRVLSGNGMTRALGWTVTAMNKPANFINKKWLKPYINQEILTVIENPIEFETPHSNTSIKNYGFEATVLPKICNAIIQASINGNLPKSTDKVVRQAYILQGAFATVGIIALVDEATGYQAERDRNELHRILEAYIAKEYLPWTKRFPDEFYQELFRLRGWTFNEATQKKPQLVGKLTNQLIYDTFPTEVLEEIKKAKIDNKKFHQKLTENIGIPHLDKRLASVITLMKVSSNWNKFINLFNRAFKGQQSFIDDIQ